MRLKVIALLVLCLVCLFSAQAQTLNTSKSSIVLNEKTADMNLVIDNLNRSFDENVLLELLDKEDKVRAKSSKSIRIKKGSKSYNFILPLGNLMQKDKNEDIIWYRLRYKIGNTSELISLSEIVRENFELRIIATDNLLSGMNYRSRIRAIDPLSQKAVKGVNISAELTLELEDENEDEFVLNAKGTTDKDGFVIMDFKIPNELNFEGDGELEVYGKKNGLVRGAYEDLDTQTDDFQFLMLTDKPIYQPEQELKIRGILLKGAEGQVVVTDEEVEFKIEDEEDTLLYRETVKTSDFGVASIAWKIPENAKLGDYKIRVKIKDGEGIASQKVKISRYDLPNFVVKPKPNKTYYLPEENEAEIEVKADYLFGKPVTKGKVRIVEEKSRKWNWKEQKYDIDEGQVREGDVDSEGKFTAKVDLSKAHEDFKDRSWRKFDDLNFTAYFTDLTTNKTEQRRFDIRVTKEAIHVYFVGEKDNVNPYVPVNAYVSTFYADGTPAVCDVELEGREDDKKKKFRTIRKTKTNSYGAGKLTFKRPSFIEEEDYMDIKLTATDKKGRFGTYGLDDDEEIDFDDDENSLQINTNRAIYKPGESVKIKVNSIIKEGLVYVDVVKGWSVIDSYFVNLKKGKATLKIPYQDNFQGELKIAAFYEKDNRRLLRTSRGIIFPTPQNLQLNAKFDKESYKPAEEGKINFSVLDKVGNAIESALGVVVFDKAVEERAKTDSEFGGMFGNFRGWLGYGESFGSVNVKDLNELDLTKPISDELQLVAEVMFYDSHYYPNIFRSRNYDTHAKSVYAKFFRKQLEPFEKALTKHYKKNYEHPTDDSSLAKILSENGLDLDSLRDPWEEKYQAIFEVKEVQNIVKIKTSGADKKFDTKDDFIVSTLSFNYFAQTGKAIDDAVKNYNKRTGKFIRDKNTLLKELNLSELKDRFGRDYHLKSMVNKRKFVLTLKSAGKNGKFERNVWYEDDFIAWTNTIDYFNDIELKIGNVLLNVKDIPLSEKDFIKTLSKKGVKFEQIKDGYGQKLYLTKKQFSRFTDKIKIENVSKYGEDRITQRKIIIPVTQEVVEFTLRSKGSDGRKGTYRDFTLAQYEFIISELTRDDKKPKVTVNSLVKKGGFFSLSGTIQGPDGLLPGATIKLTDPQTGRLYVTTSDDIGNYRFYNLVSGNYSARITAPGFKTHAVNSIRIDDGKTYTLNVVLEVGLVSVEVAISAGAEVVNTSSSSLNTDVKVVQILDLPINGRNALDLVNLQAGVAGRLSDSEVLVIDGKKFIQDEYGKLVSFSEISTPRLREYFPETLLWNPEVITDKNGKAEIKFKMADNITTWKMYTIASTKTGKIGFAEKEVTAFQPFFVDLEPPKFLTEGDEIYLPTQVRNYTKQKQKVDVTMAKADWFSFLNAETRTSVSVTDSLVQNLVVEKGESENAVFGFKADKFIRGGKQRVTAIAETDSDAIEKPVTVRPNGQEIVKTESKLFRQHTGFDVNFPSNVIEATPKAELKIYPNLLAHVAESVEGLLKRPYGCGEQTISSTYPNLMILKFTPKENKLRTVANKFLKKGYERLLGYQVSSGGFSYWGGSSSADIALTAYAVRFLTDAKSKIEIDESVIKRAEDWLILQQRSDGSWTTKYYYERAENRNRTKMLTSYIARTLAMTESKNKNSLKKALAFLKARNAEIDEPYAMALYGLAALQNGDSAEANSIVQRLSAMAIPEGNGVYWKLETNTPFYGWGKAGRIETTALVVQLLTKISSKDAKGQNKTQNLIAKGTQFLLKNKDRYGVWYSTQTTINVLDAFLATLQDDSDENSPQKRIAEVLINGQVAKTYDLPPKDQLANPITLRMSSLLTQDNNRVELRTNDNSSIMSQVVQEHYIRWQDANISNSKTNKSRQIRLEYSCDKQNMEILQETTCEVKAERIGFKGYGMLLAEIGIPPGADVSRESLEEAFDADWSLSKYDVLPDRIIVYMWSKAGGTNFKFKFKPRYGINAQTPASFVYDYYNEEAKATVAPMRFVVK